VKKGVVMKGQANQVEGHQVVNDVLWARQNSLGQDCQNRVDVKALTGRGTLAKLRQEVAKIDDLLNQMNELAKATKSVSGLGIYLVVHQRKSSGYVFLRWRERLGSNRHLDWDEAQDLTRLQPEAVRAWCRQVSVIAQQLNADHLRCREEIKRVRKEVSLMKPHLFQRSIF